MGGDGVEDFYFYYFFYKAAKYESVAIQCAAKLLKGGRVYTICCRLRLHKNRDDGER